MICTKCGASNPEGMWECANCKAPLVPANSSTEDLNNQYITYAQSQWRSFVKSPLILILLIIQTLALASTLVLGLANLGFLIVLLITNIGSILTLVAMWRIYSEATVTKPFSTKGIDMLIGLYNIIRWVQIIGIIVYVFVLVLEVAAARATTVGSGLGIGNIAGMVIGAGISVCLINFIYKSLIELLTGVQHAVTGKYPAAPKAILLAVLQFLAAAVSAFGNALLQNMGGAIQIPMNGILAAITPVLMGVVLLVLHSKVNALLPVYDAWQKQIKAARDSRENTATEQTVDFDNLPTWKKVELMKQQEEARKQQEQ